MSVAIHHTEILTTEGEFTMTYGQSEMFGSSPFRDVLRALDARAKTTREKGDLFEELAKTFFEEDALYREHFEGVWLWSEWPERGGRPDTGIDLVAKNADDGDLHRDPVQVLRSELRRQQG